MSGPRNNGGEDDDASTTSDGAAAVVGACGTNANIDISVDDSIGSGFGRFVFRLVNAGAAVHVHRGVPVAAASVGRTPPQILHGPSAGGRRDRRR
jgi:hypothetical protein